MSLPDVVKALQLLALNDPVAVRVAVIVSHTEQCEQLSSRIIVDLFKFSVGVLGLVEVINEGVSERLIGEERPIGDTASIMALHLGFDGIGYDSAHLGRVLVVNPAAMECDYQQKQQE